MNEGGGVLLWSDGRLSEREDVFFVVYRAFKLKIRPEEMLYASRRRAGRRAFKSDF